ncbi:hypothetical protein OGM63_01690 [Plectonema radiosum NIES-515]|uniref:Uncharacterized protein n=1 Tax=Plectonema radiosum NIES-515 TaxID=2986073 RepID=A0ABT3AU47_9CYAN|nr:hypothetical protein [Plectonema radiosum]MCV3212250.1 hypothetical protein [Plectonema radiosum NIES-515]
MSPQREDDLQQSLQQLEEEMNSSSPKVVVEQPKAKKQTFQLNFLALKSHLERFKIWFKSLSGTGKIVVGSVSVLFGLAMLQAVFKLVASVVSLAVLAGLVYLGYKFFVSGSFQRKQ